MDTQPGQVTIPHDDEPDQAQPQQPASAPAPVSDYAEQPPQTNPIVPGQSYTPPSPAQTFEEPVPGTPSGSYAAPPANAAPYSDQEADWLYSQGDDPTAPAGPLPDDITWTASEFIEHPKSVGWYGLLVLSGLALAGLDYFFSKDLISTSVIIIAAALFGVYASHKPQTKQYHLSPEGLQIGKRTYQFQTFKAFSVASEGATVGIVFTPLGRFVPTLTIYVSSDIEDSVLDYLSIFLPFEQHRGDLVEGLLRRIKF